MIFLFLNDIYLSRAIISKNSGKYYKILTNYNSIHSIPPNLEPYEKKFLRIVLKFNKLKETISLSYSKEALLLEQYRMEFSETKLITEAFLKGEKRFILAIKLLFLLRESSFKNPTPIHKAYIFNNGYLVKVWFEHGVLQFDRRLIPETKIEYIISKLDSI